MVLAGLRVPISFAGPFASVLLPSLDPWTSIQPWIHHSAPEQQTRRSDPASNLNSPEIQDTWWLHSCRIPSFELQPKTLWKFHVKAQPKKLRNASSYRPPTWIKIHCPHLNRLQISCHDWFINWFINGFKVRVGVEHSRHALDALMATIGCLKARESAHLPQSLVHEKQYAKR